MWGLFLERQCKIDALRIYYFVIGRRTDSSLSDVWPTFQIWGRSDKNCGGYRRW